MSTLAIMEAMTEIYEEQILAGILRKLCDRGRILPGETLASVRFTRIRPHDDEPFLQLRTFTFPDYSRPPCER